MELRIRVVITITTTDHHVFVASLDFMELIVLKIVTTAFMVNDAAISADAVQSNFAIIYLDAFLVIVEVQRFPLKIMKIPAPIMFQLPRTHLYFL